jgi:hypothetical protein
MKNVNGLANAMRLVESACEKGEITIIGEGGMPTPVELYKKCVAFINKQYGVDILNLVLKEQKPCECNGSCTTITVDTEVDDKHYLDVNLGKLVEVADLYISEHLPYLSGETVEDIVEDIRKAYCNVIDGMDSDEYDEEECIDYICDAFSDNIDTENYDENSLRELCEAIAHRIEVECIDEK